LDSFTLSDGYRKCFAYGTGYIPPNTDADESQAEGNEVGESLNEDDEDINVSKDKRSKNLILYGKDLTLYVAIRRNGDNEIAVAEKAVSGKAKNAPLMQLGYGELCFVRESFYMSEKVKKVLSESSEYLNTWDRYSNMESETLFFRARSVGLIKHHPPVPDKDSFIVNLTDESTIDKLSIGDSLAFSDSIPSYIENEDMTWAEYSEALSSKKIWMESQNADVAAINKGTNSVTVKTKPGQMPTLPYLSVNIIGDAMQIISRENARKAIMDGQCAMPMLGLILEGVGTSQVSGASAARKVNRIPTMSAFIKDKIFSTNPPTDTQTSAIEIALNTPDIAVIQGPPGTGKTTVITAIIERLNEMFDKREDIRGKVLVTSFQHDAVENVIRRLRINSLPTVKFGNRSGQTDNEFNIEKMIDEWCDETAGKIQAKNTHINYTEEMREFERLFRFYEMSPGDQTALAFLKFAKKLAITDELAEQTEEIIDTFGEKDYKRFDVKSAVQRLRVTETGFCDDGTETAIALYDELELILDGGDNEHAEILQTLRNAVQTDGPPSSELLVKLRKIRRSLLEKMMTQSVYKTEKPRADIVELYNALKKCLRKPQNEVDGILLDFLSELEYNPTSVKKALTDYGFVFSASAQQSVGKDIEKAKNKDITYDTVIVDEAARANPGALMIPLTQAKRRIILVGDHRQLPHMFDDEIVEKLQEENADFNIESIKTSMFEQLWNSAKKLESSDGIRRTVTLDAQYRMHPLLGNFVNDNFYMPHGEYFASPLEGSNFQQDLFASPCVWMDVKHKAGGEKRLGTSRTRAAEADVIVRKIKELASRESGKDLSYGVISFYSAQVALIKSRLDEGLRDKVRVGSVDAFQGMEFDIIFLSIVRTQKDMPGELPANNDKNIGRKYFGFMMVKNRLCVAVSRQKKVLVAVGNSDMFRNAIAAEYVPEMKKYYELCVENGGVIDV